MNLVYLDISLRLEDYLNKMIKETDYNQYEVYICDEDWMEDLFVRGEVYKTITFVSHDKKITIKDEEFRKIISVLETKRKINSWYERMIQSARNSEYENLEMSEPAIVGGVITYPIYLAAVALVLTLVFSPALRIQLLVWIQKYFQVLI